MDIMITMKFILFSPIAIFGLIVGLFYLLRPLFKVRTSIFDCMGSSFKGGIITAGASLVAFVLWMVWLSFTTNHDLGQTPFVWIFGIGPISFTVGLIGGFIVWCKFILKTSKRIK